MSRGVYIPYENLTPRVGVSQVQGLGVRPRSANFRTPDSFGSWWCLQERSR